MACYNIHERNAPGTALGDHRVTSTFYLPPEFSQSNIFADADTGRITFTDSQGIEVLIRINETSFLSRYYEKDISNAQDYAQIYSDSQKDTIQETDQIKLELSNQYDVPYIILCGTISAITQYGTMGFYSAGAYCATIAVYTENADIFNTQKADMLHYATVAVFTK